MRLSMREKEGSKPGLLEADGLKFCKTTHLFEKQRSATAQVINAERF